LPQIVAAVMPAPRVPVELREFPEPVLEIRGCWGSEVSHFVRALRMLERHRASVPWRAIGATTSTLAELNQALADAMRLPKALVKPR
jgi:hypothetical protein